MHCTVPGWGAPECTWVTQGLVRARWWERERAGGQEEAGEANEGGFHRVGSMFHVHMCASEQVCSSCQQHLAGRHARRKEAELPPLQLGGRCCCGGRAHAPIVSSGVACKQMRAHHVQQSSAFALADTQLTAVFLLIERYLKEQVVPQCLSATLADLQHCLARLDTPATLPFACMDRAPGV